MAEQGIKKPNIFDKINLKDPYQWWAILLFLVIAVAGGGAIGGLVGFIGGFSILSLQTGSFQTASHIKRIIVYSLITIGSAIVYGILSLIAIFALAAFFPQILHASS